MRTAAGIKWADLLDVLVVAALIYFLLASLGRQRARAFVLVLGGVGISYLLARTFGLHLASMLMGAGLWIATLLAVIAFQDDIRRSLHRITALRIMGGRGTSADLGAAAELIASVVRMAEHKVGALIVVPGHESLQPHLTSGLVLDGHLSGPLLESIFNPDSPGHDGAAIVEGGIVRRFAVYLPLSKRAGSTGRLGTRHAAALGLSEQCDAMVIVVSEERGEISIAQNGVLDQGLSLTELEARILPLAGVTPRPRPRGTAVRGILSRAGIAVFTASVLWFVLVFLEGTVQQTLMVPIEYRNVPDAVALLEPRPATVQVTIAGRRAAFQGLAGGDVSAAVDLSHAQAGFHRLAIDRSDISLPPTLDVLEIHPSVVNLRLLETEIERRPVRVAVVGGLPPGARLEVSPASVRVRAAEGSRDDGPITTEPIDLSRLEDGRSAKLILPAGLRLMEGEASTVEVRLRRNG